MRSYLGPDYDVDTHFTPSYRPWRQRIAFIPDGDLFQGIRTGKASIVTDEIERFTETGILLKSGKLLDADIIVTATGFNLNVLGDIDFAIDGKPLIFADTVTYRGMMFTGIPNMAWVFGYFRASWTLRADLVADFVCRLLNHMKQKGARGHAGLRPEDKDMPLLPWIDPENFNPGYLMRGMHLLPKRGDKPNGSTLRTTGTRRTSSPPSTSTTRRSSTADPWGCRRCPTAVAVRQAASHAWRTDDEGNPERPPDRRQRRHRRGRRLPLFPAIRGAPEWLEKSPKDRRMTLNARTACSSTTW